MGDENTASTLVLVAAILQLILSLFSMVGGTFTALMLLPFMFDPFMMMVMGWLILLTVILNIVIGVVGIIFSIIWFSWRHSPSEHKTGLIATGILGLLLAGIIPGLLALIGGVTAPSPTEYLGYEPAKTVSFKTERRCSSCGAEATEDDQYCWRCGARL
ncbi:MAG: zinc ribbon domain-containing protein [Candidatus Hermodarchaeota archaeon]|nr:zinc ribbon domain-containing protein [Candidatus Hermodarchaeota archaeon]